MQSGKAAWLACVCLASVVGGCGSAPAYRDYKPVEVDVTSKDASFARAQAAVASLELLPLEESLELGVVTTQWQPHAGKHYNLQILISPVRSVVKIGCRIERALDLHPCREKGYPADLVDAATELTKRMRVP